MKVVKITKIYVTEGTIFRVNQEYELCNTFLKTEGCSSCGGGNTKKVPYYQISLNGKLYLIHSANAVIIDKNTELNTISPEQAFQLKAGDPNDNRNYDELRVMKQQDGFGNMMARIYESINNIPM